MGGIIAVMYQAGSSTGTIMAIDDINELLCQAKSEELHKIECIQYKFHILWRINEDYMDIIG